MNFGDPSAIGTEMADRFVVSGANLPPLFKIGLMHIKPWIIKQIESKICQITSTIQQK